MFHLEITKIGNPLKRQFGMGAGITRSREGKGKGEKRSEKWNTPGRWVGERGLGEEGGLEDSVW